MARGGGGRKMMKLMRRASRAADEVAAFGLNGNSFATSPAEAASGSSRRASPVVNNPRSVGYSGDSLVSAKCSCANCWASLFGAEDDYELVFNDSGIERDSSLLASPSVDEVTDAVSAITGEFGDSRRYQFVEDRFAVYDGAGDHGGGGETSPCRVDHLLGGDADWVEPSPGMCYTGTQQSLGSRRVFDAFRLLQIDPSLQRMVISISSDQAVWDAVLNNEVVRELRDACSSDASVSLPNQESSKERDEDCNPVLTAVTYILEGSKLKLQRIFKTLAKLVESLFRSLTGEKDSATSHEVEERIKISFLLSIIVLFVVVVTRCRIR